MKETVEKIINYLNIGYSPTILSFPDDGIIHLYDELSSLKQKPQNYDLPYIFLYLSTQSFKSLDIERLESAVELEIGNISDGRSIIEILKKGFEIVVIIDDMEVFGDSYETVAAIDGLIKKYQNKIKFVYLIEYPNIDLKFPDPFPTSSSIFDATIHFKIGS